jgi:hypothetical protein
MVVTKQTGGFMKVAEYIFTCTAIAGVFFVFTLWQPDQYTPLLAKHHTQMLCPDLQIRHSVGGNLKTGIKVVDACASYVNVNKY